MTPPIPRFAIGQLVWALQGTEILGPFPVISVSLYASQHERLENYVLRGDSFNAIEFRGASLFESFEEADLVRRDRREQQREWDARKKARRAAGGRTEA